MADSTIQGLLNIDNLANDDLLPIWDNSAGNDNTKKASALQVSKFVGSAGQSSVNITTNTKDWVVNISGKDLQDAMTLSVTAIVEITGNENDVLTIAYNGGSAKNIKVNKDGVLADYTPFNISDTYKFMQAFTSLDMKYIESLDCWLVVGNPVAISDSSSTSGYSIMTDGKIRQWIRVVIGSSAIYTWTYPVRMKKIIALTGELWHSNNFSFYTNDGGNADFRDALNYVYIHNLASQRGGLFSVEGYI